MTLHHSPQHRRSLLPVTVLLLALVLSGCGTGSVPTPTQTPTPAATATLAPTATSLPVEAAAPQSTLGALGGEIAAAVVDKVSDDALTFVLEKGAANVTADQLTAALLGLLGGLQRWVAGAGGDTAIEDCRALLPGVIARSTNHAPLDALLAACESGDKAAVTAALEPLKALLP